MKMHREDADKGLDTPKQPINPILQELVDKHIPDVIWELNLTHQKFTYISPSVYQLRGLTVEEALHEDFHNSLHEEDYHFIVNYLQPRVSLFENGDESMKIHTGEFRQPKKDGSYVDVEITTILIKNLQGKVDRIAGISRKITHRKSQIIRILNDDLQIKNREMEQLVFITSHDLRSPLVNIRGFSSELQYSLKEIIKLYKEYDKDGLAQKALPIEKEIQESLDYINLSIVKMDRLLKGLLEYSRLGRKIKAPTVISMGDLVAEVIKTNEYQLKNSHIIIEVSKLPNCWASEQMINQAFSNLLSNAIKYREDSRKCNIKITGEQTENNVTYCIEDNGIGIEPRHQQKVFELFYRLYPEKGEGEGLGLSTVKKIIELNGGRIRMESEPGKGTKFFVTLPSESSFQPHEASEQN